MPAPLEPAVQNALIDHHNSVVRRASVRALDLEQQMVNVLTPLFDRAADEAARNFTTYAARPLTVTGSSTPGVTSLSTMIAVRPTAEQRDTLTQPEGLPAEEIHCTIAYVGDYPGDLADLAAVVQHVAASHAPLHGEVGGVATFADNGNGTPAIVLPDVRGLSELRVAICEALIQAGIDYPRTHGFEAHITIAYGDGDPPPDSLLGLPLDFLELCIVRGDEEEVTIPFTGALPITAGFASRDSKDSASMPEETQPDETVMWRPPAVDLVLDVEALTAALHEHMDPVAEKACITVMRTAVEEAPIPKPKPVPNAVTVTAAGKKRPPKADYGISFDIRNPYAQDALKKAGSNIKGIAESTQAKVGRIIRKSYADGDSIPTTAAAIKNGMRSLSPARATLIARTELAGATNGGSLAGTQMLDEAAGGLGINKVWLTAPGAIHPRHETYEGLGGQTQPLPAPFEVGGEQLLYPGDPNGDPAEVCNCRCAISYTKAGQEIEQVSAEDAIDPMMIAEDAEGGDFDTGGDVQAAINNLVPGETDTTDYGPTPPEGYATDGPATLLIDNEQQAWGENLSVEQKGALTSWKSEKGYSEINDYLRNGVKSEGVENQVALLDKVTETAPALTTNTQTFAFRGVRDLQAVFGGTETPEIGARFVDPGFQSFSTEWGTAYDYATSKTGGVIVAELPDDYQGLVSLRAAGVENTHGGSMYSSMGENKELLLPRNQGWEVVGHGEHDGFPLVRVRPVARPEPTIAEDASSRTMLDTLPKQVNILEQPTTERPYGHLKQRGLDRRIEGERSFQRKMLAQTEMAPVERYKLMLSQERLQAAIKERELRAGIVIDRPFAHLTDDDLHRLRNVAESQVNGIKGTTANTKIKKAEAQQKLDALQKEVDYREQVLTPTPARGAKERERAATQPRRPRQRQRTQTTQTVTVRKPRAKATAEQPDKAAPTKERAKGASRGRSFGGVEITREPYTPPVKAKNARMSRLQKVYKARYDATKVERGAWSVSYATDAPSLAEVKAAGADFYQEVEERVARATKGQEYVTGRQVTLARRDAIKQVLSEIRPMGADLEGLTLQSDPLAAQWVKAANEYFPSDWGYWVGDVRVDVQQVEGAQPSSVQIARDGSRAVVSVNNSAYNEASTHAVEAMQKTRASLHELSHVYEHFVPDLQYLEQQYYAERTAGERLVRQYEAQGKLGKAAGSLVRPDEWVNAYMGRDYEHKWGSTDMPTGPFEILSMGMEGIFTGSYPIWEQDAETAQVILGILVSF